MVTWTLEICPGLLRVLVRPGWAGDSIMKRTRHTAEKIIRKLTTAVQLIAQGKTVADVCRVIEVTQPIYHQGPLEVCPSSPGEALTAAVCSSGQASLPWPPHSKTLVLQPI